MKLKTLDLFTGIGGFTVALGDVANIVGYCDNHVGSRTNLADLIQRGYLPRAPIFHDVKTIGRHNLPPDINMVTAGFPCQDISTMNIEGKGIYGHRSGLIFEVVRICAETRADVLVLENSPNLEHRGLKIVIDNLYKIGMTNVTWDVFSAAEVGAPHSRRRMFLIAYRNGSKARRSIELIRTTLSRSISKSRDPWKTTAPSRVIPKSQANLIMLQRRGYMLGNSIVPYCAKVAVCSLAITALTSPSRSSSNARWMPTTLTHESDFKIEMNVPTSKIIRKPGVETIESDYVFRQWSTPLSTKWTPSRIGTLRSAFHLPNQILYEVNTRKYMQKRKKHSKIDDWIVNPEFIEWMMGYPLGWTLAAADAAFTTSATRQIK